MRSVPKSVKLGFTLIELLVVVAILGILTMLVASTFRTSQMKSRDGQRKSDLKQIANALETFYSDHGQYPPADGNGSIKACPFVSASQATACTWGSGQITDNKTVYFQKMPKDPASTTYFYRTLPVGSTTPQKFQLFAYLENNQDQDIVSTSLSYNCGVYKCNFAVTSSNTDYSE
jgi:type II secretion system protein G